MNGRLWCLVGATFGLLGVILGAFGAHALKDRLPPDLIATYRTAVEYQIYHALALLAVGLLAMLRPEPRLNASGLCFSLGILVFSGSLYALALSGQRLLGIVTPIGGVLFIAGWGLMIAALWRS